MKNIDTVIAPTDILTEELNDVIGGGCQKTKNKCKDGTIKKEESSLEIESW